MKTKNPTPLESVRKYCLWCVYDSPNEVKLCPTTDCPLYSFRFGKGRISVKDIRKRCMDCGEGTSQAVKKCEFPECSLYPYRLGKNPNRKGVSKGTPENLKNYKKITVSKPDFQKDVASEHQTILNFENHGEKN